MSNLLSQASLVMIPSGYKEDVVYSQIPTNGNGDLSFTRASNGTRVNSAGLVEDVPWNLLQQSNTFNTTWAFSGTGTVTSGATDPFGGTSAWTLAKTTANTFIYQSTSGLLGSVTFSIYAKAGSVDQLHLRHDQTTIFSAYFDLTNGTTVAATNCVASIVAIGGGWFLCSIIGDVLTPNNIRIYPASSGSISGSTGNILIYGAQANQGALKPYFPTTDRLNVPRLTYQNGGGGCPSLLLEKQSTNLITYSEQIQNADWNVIGGDLVVTGNATTSPDGTQNAGAITLANSANRYFVHNLFSITGGVAYTYSVWMKSASGTLQINMGGVNGLPGVLKTVTTEWQRFTYTFTPATTYAEYFGFDNRGAGSSTSGTLYFWGAQVEQSSYPTSYIPTTSSSATRVADGPLNLSTTQALTNFTLFWDGLIFENGANMFFGSGNSAWYIDIDGSTNRVVLDLSSGRIYSGFNAGITTNQRFKLAVKRSAGVVDAFVNGTKLTPVYLVTDTTSLTLSSITWGFSSTYYPKMKVNEICAFQSALTDAECQSLTTL